VAELRQKTAQVGVAPSWLQPIETRVVMLQSGIRSSIGLEIRGDDPEVLERLAVQVEPWIREVPGAADVTALRLGGKPYLEFHLDRRRMATYGVSVRAVQDVIEVAIGGKALTMSVEGRERYPIRIRYPRERRDRAESLARILVPTRDGSQVPITEVARIEHVVGPASLRSVDGKLVSYVMLNAVGRDEVSVVEDARRILEEKVRSGELELPQGYFFGWTGRFENQVRANARLRMLIPLCLLINFLLLYLNFRRAALAAVVFLAIPVAFAGGFIMIELWPAIQDALFAIGLYPAASLGPVYLTVAVWVGFIALFGIAVDDGVVLGTYLDQVFRRGPASSIAEIRERVLEAGLRRIRPCLMTTFTTLIALTPILWATGRGADVMQPMALPVVGGMAVELITLFVVPCCYCFVEERRFRRRRA
jgi:Cu(I)/Ag(I) efflux system membrane protein CusA/SilA